MKSLVLITTLWLTLFTKLAAANDTLRVDGLSADSIVNETVTDVQPETPRKLSLLRRIIRGFGRLDNHYIEPQHYVFTVMLQAVTTYDLYRLSGVNHDAQSVTWDYSVEDTFHIVTMIWTPTSIDMYMDKEAHPEYGAYFHADLEPNEDADYNRQLVFGKPNFVIANLAVGGNFPGIYSVNQITALSSGPKSVYIDWIRIYQRGDANQSFSCPSASDEIEPDGGQGIESVQSSDVSGQKELRDGQIIIRRNGEAYTIMGIKVERVKE